VTAGEIREAVLRVLAGIAPEADLATLRPDAGLRDQLDIDSMDFLNLAIGINHELQVDIPETEYDRLQTLDDVVGYLAERTGVSG
jgi:acyl carrier protein